MTEENTKGGLRACDGSRAKVTDIYYVQFESKDTSKPPATRIAVEIEFLEGPNAKSKATWLGSMKNLDFLHTTLKTIGWTSVTQRPTDIPRGKEIRGTVAEEINPKTGDARMILKWLNPVDGGGAGMGKYKMEPTAAKQLEDEFLMMMKAHLKAKGGAVAQTPARQEPVRQEPVRQEPRRVAPPPPPPVADYDTEGGREDDEIPF